MCFNIDIDAVDDVMVMTLTTLMMMPILFMFLVMLMVIHLTDMAWHGMIAYTANLTSFFVVVPTFTTPFMNIDDANNQGNDCCS